VTNRGVLGLEVGERLLVSEVLSMLFLDPAGRLMHVMTIRTMSCDRMLR
jgi:hypothetical protein